MLEKKNGLILFMLLMVSNVVGIFLLTNSSHQENGVVLVGKNDNLTDIEEDIDSDILMDPKIVRPSAVHDADGDKIADSLSAFIEKKENEFKDKESGKDEMIEVFLCTTKEIDESMKTKLEPFNVEIKSAHDELIYGVSAEVPMNRLSELASLDEITLIEKSPTSHTHLDTSTVIMGARGSSYVWGAKQPIKGNSSYSIAILDTGVDSNHSDMENVIHFRDFTDHHYENGTEGVDYGHHGTHCASIAAGTGAADTNPETVNVSFADEFTDTIGSFWSHAFEVKDNANNPNTVLNMTWDDSSGGTVRLGLVDMDSPAHFINGYTTSLSSPVIKDEGNLPAGWYRAYCSADDDSAKGKNYTVQVNHEYNYTVNDPFNTPLFVGVAPQSKIVSLKVLNDTGSGTGTWFIKALDWISNHGKEQEYNITVVSMSLGFDGIYAYIDTAVDQLVSQGFVCVASAGNDGTNDGNNAIGSPGNAKKCITVGAVNDALEVSYYSSNGAEDMVYIKPDVLAPGGTAAPSGSNATYNKIIAADSNYKENDKIIPDVYPNDYVGMQGTSMAAPHVSGLAQLVIDALIRKDGKAWTWSEQNALKVKQLICMGTWEVNAGENFDGDGDGIPQRPPINRNCSDVVEGYGMVRADAVIQAILNMTTDSLTNKQFYLDRRNSTHAKDPKVLLFGFEALAGKIYNFTLNVSINADFDLLIYDKDFNTTTGRPIVLRSSMNKTLGGNESITFSPDCNGIYYWSVRAVQGYGNCKISMNPEDDVEPPEWSNLVESSDPLEYGEFETITIKVTDVGVMDSVWISLGSANYTMSKIGGNTYQFSWKPGGLGFNNYTIYMNDTSGNLNYVKGVVTVRDTTRPTWDQDPTDQTIEYGQKFRYDLNASDAAGIYRWWLSDPSNNFTIDNNGVLTNKSMLTKDNYTIEIRAYDSSDNNCNATIMIKVKNLPNVEVDDTGEEDGDEEDTDAIPGFNLIFIIAINVCLAIILIKKKH